MATTGLSSPNRQLVYDEIRKRWVKATPEEIVRQTWICRMVHHLGFPRELIAVEKSLGSLPLRKQVKVPSRRVDLVAFAKGKTGRALFPLILIECKVEGLDRKAIAQVIGYNYFIQSPFVAVVNATDVLLGRIDPKRQEYVFEHTLPSYHELLTSGK
jgi:hypothetical protein